MNGYSSHTYMWINAGGEKFWVKYHFKTDQGVEFLTQSEGAAIAAENADAHIQDLWESIKGGDCPTWTLNVQIMPFEAAANYRFNPFDVTKVWPHGDYPLIKVGRYVLDRNPENYFAEVEQSAFTPANVVPGISFSPDKMLQSRLFSYGDAQRYRLGVNHHQIPVNAPKCPFHSYHRDGAMRVDGNHGGTLGYEPNSYEQWKEQPDFSEPPLAIEGAADHWNHREDTDYYSQPGDLFRLMTPAQRQILFENTARSVGGASKAIQERHVENCRKADPAYGDGVAAALKKGVSSPTPNAVV